MRRTDAGDPGWKELFRLSRMEIFAIAFVLLLGAVGAVLVAQITASPRAPWISIALSACAIVVTVVAVAARRRE